MKISCLINNIRVYLKLICILIGHIQRHFARYEQEQNTQHTNREYISE